MLSEKACSLQDLTSEQRQVFCAFAIQWGRKVCSSSGGKVQNVFFGDENFGHKLGSNYCQTSKLF